MLLVNKFAFFVKFDKKNLFYLFIQQNDFRIASLILLELSCVYLKYVVQTILIYLAWRFTLEHFFKSLGNLTWKIWQFVFVRLLCDRYEVLKKKSELHFVFKYWCLIDDESLKLEATETFLP